jgi:hypothetical protein
MADRLLEVWKEAALSNSRWTAGRAKADRGATEGRAAARTVCRSRDVRASEAIVIDQSRESCSTRQWVPSARWEWVSEVDKSEGMLKCT